VDGNQLKVLTMKHPLQLLQSDLDQLLHLLGQPSFFSLSAEERQGLRSEADRLLRKLASVESTFLTVGLLGGTGVGKSTLMNALAGSEIASASHRRPHTDRVLIYRHAEAEQLPGLPLTDVPWREIVHEGDDIRQVLLCDLPDFDSLLGEHREHVLGFMEHLDVLIWTTSPEKYADKRFYELLHLASKAEQNYYFVLNKVDLLFEGGSLETGYEQMASVVSAFQHHIRDNGIADPLLYMLSSQEGLTPDALSPWNQFLAFRKQLFQQRDIKQITAIKAATLDVEVQQLQSLFQKEVLNLETFEEILGGAAQELEKQRSTWIQSGQEAIDLWLSNHIKQDIQSSHGDPSRLVGPGFSLAVLLEAWQRRLARDKGSPSIPALFVLPDDIAASFRRRLQWLEDWLNHRILRQNLPSSFRERLAEILDVKKTSEDLEERLSHAVALRAAAPFLPSFFGFKALQVLTYFLLFAFLLFAIGGGDSLARSLGRSGGIQPLSSDSFEY